MMCQGFYAEARFHYLISSFCGSFHGMQLSKGWSELRDADTEQGAFGWRCSVEFREAAFLPVGNRLRQLRSLAERSKTYRKDLLNSNSLFKLHPFCRSRKLRISLVKRWISRMLMIQIYLFLFFFFLCEGAKRGQILPVLKC